MARSPDRASSADRRSPRNLPRPLELQETFGQPGGTVLVSAGFDAYALDPIGSLGLEVEDFAWLTRQVIVAAHAIVADD